MTRKPKNPILRAEWPRVYDQRPSGMTFMVDARPHGKREYFDKASEAKARADQLAAERENRGTEALNFPTDLRVMAVECLEKLRPFGKNLRDATDHYVAWLTSERNKHESLLMSECIQQYLASRQADRDRGELAPKSFLEIRQRANQLAGSMGGLHIAAVTPDSVKTYLDRIPFGQYTRISVRMRMSAFFNFCKLKGWIDRNPCEIVTIKAKRADTQILSVAEAERLLAAAQESEFAAVAVPYAAICLFAGLRPGEADQLDWRQVHFDTETIEVLAHTSKTRDSRFVKMEPTLIQWIKPYAKASGLVVGANFRKKWNAVKSAAGYAATAKETQWVQDIMRHTYASYWLATHQDRAKLAELMGNSVDVIRAHYRRPIVASEAERFWALTPR